MKHAIMKAGGVGGGERARLALRGVVIPARASVCRHRSCDGCTSGRRNCGDGLPTLTPRKPQGRAAVVCG